MHRMEVTMRYTYIIETVVNKDNGKVLSRVRLLKNYQFLLKLSKNYLAIQSIFAYKYIIY